MKCKTEKAPLTTRQYFRPNVEEDGRRGIARLQDPDDAGLLLDEQSAGSIASVANERRIGDAARNDRHELDLGVRRRCKDNNRGGCEPYAPRGSFHGRPLLYHGIEAHGAAVA